MILAVTVNPFGKARPMKRVEQIHAFLLQMEVRKW